MINQVMGPGKEEKGGEGNKLWGFCGSISEVYWKRVCLRSQG